MATKLLMVLVGLVVIGGVLAARVMCSIFALRQEDKDLSRWNDEGGAVLSKGDYLPY